jgi:hypothetical protein
MKTIHQLCKILLVFLVIIGGRSYSQGTNESVFDVPFAQRRGVSYSLPKNLTETLPKQAENRILSLESGEENILPLLKKVCGGVGLITSSLSIGIGLGLNLGGQFVVGTPLVGAGIGGLIISVYLLSQNDKQVTSIPKLIYYPLPSQEREILLKLCKMYNNEPDEKNREGY